MLLKVGFDRPVADGFKRLLDLQLVATPVLVLQEFATSETDESPLAHDANPVSEEVGFVHVVSS